MRLVRNGTLAFEVNETVSEDHELKAGTGRDKVTQKVQELLTCLLHLSIITYLIPQMFQGMKSMIMELSLYTSQMTP